MMEERNTLHPF